MFKKIQALNPLLKDKPFGLIPISALEGLDFFESDLFKIICLKNENGLKQIFCLIRSRA